MKKYLLIALIFGTQLAIGQGKTEEDKKTLEGLKASVNYLADDKLEGRRTGTAGEKLAYEFIAKQFKKYGLLPEGDKGTYIQAFPATSFLKIKSTGEMTTFILNHRTKKLIYDSRRDKVLKPEFFPFAYSAWTKKSTFSEGDQDSPYCKIYDIGPVLILNKDNPHFDLKNDVLEAANKAMKEGKHLFMVKNSSDIKDGLAFDPEDKTKGLSIPAFYFNVKDEKEYKYGDQLTVSIATIQETSTGHNVVGFIDNGAPTTIVLGAHYDHLGYGQDHNSLYTGTTPMIHNGADDNASGTAALIELSKWLKNDAPKKTNYLLTAFSGEELGLYGSKYLVEHSPIDLKSVSYMINMDMVGRLNDSTHGLTIGGYGTSPAWSELIKTDDPYFKIKVDSAGSGPSDHTSFYRKDIPVLFFFTGTHSDYHKPTDDADKINFNGELEVMRYIKKIITATAEKDKIAFTKTRETSMGKNTFKVSLGIMPDYTFSGEGVLVDGVSDNRPAQKAGIKTGDVLVQLGEHAFTDVQTYMGALNKFEKGDTTTVKLKRGKEEFVLPITF